MIDRREMIRGIGRALCAGAAVPFIPTLIKPDIIFVSEFYDFAKEYHTFISGVGAVASKMVISNVGDYREFPEYAKKEPSPFLQLAVAEVEAKAKYFAEIESAINVYPHI